MNRKISGLFVILILIIMSYTTVFGVTFMDMNGHWAKDVVYEMVERGVINGFEDGTYRPNENVTREQFAKLLVETFELKKNNINIKFEDVSDDRWSKKYVEIANKYLTGFVNDGKYYFKPEESTVREDVAVAVVIASGLEKEKPNYSLLNQFSDEDKISENLRKYIAIAVEHEIMRGKGGYFDPQGNLTRAEVAQLLLNVIEKEEEDEKIVIEEIEKCVHETKNEYEYNNESLHRVKVICKKCEEITKNELENHTFKSGKCVCGAEEKVEESIIYGDVNGNGQINISDYILLKQTIEGIYQKEINEIAADVDKDGKITENDCWLIKIVAQGENTKLPHGCNSHTEKYQSLDEEKHKKIEKCKCGEISHENTELHTFEEGKCVCGYEKVKEILYGDADDNGIIDLLDATRIWGYPSSSEPFNFKNADVNLDGKIDDFDYIYILNKVYYNWELPHTCGNYYTDIEIINTEQHKTILSCSCKGEILTIARNHEYINGECICGSKIVYGDVNNDGSIDMDDVTLLTEMLEGKAVDINELAADVFLDDDIEEFDRDLLLKYVKKEYNGELPHTCEGYTWKKETKVDDVQHKLVYRCDCGEIKSLTVYAEHVFEDGECVCGYKEVKEIILGDINNDGKVNLVDYEELEKYVKGGSNGKTYNLNNADVNLDGNIDIYDVYLIRISKYTGWPNGIELPHQCSNFMQEYEIIDNNKHLKVISCQCKTLMYKISYQHKFKNGKCVCGALESVDIKDIKVGDYIKYSANGYNEWRVLYNNDGQIDIVSVGSVGDFTLEGNGSYLKAVSELNAFANKFKTGLAISARSIGCTATSTATVSSGKWDMTGSPYEDRLYEKDINQLKNNGLVQSDKEVWLASRAIEGVLGGTAGKVRTLLANGSTNSHKLQSYTLFGQTDRKSKTFGFRPVISLPANLIVVAGDGKTLDTAFELSK